MASADVYALVPDAPAAIRALGAAAEQAGLDPGMLELVKLRASQINGCAFCVQYHIDLALGLGVPRPKLDLVAVWREAGIFDAREMAALAWAETLTLLAETRVPDAAYEAARAVFDDRELAALTVAVATINVWNRISVAYRFPPPLAAS
jgi:AhpD family alkylhydroperoxidase